MNAISKRSLKHILVASAMTMAFAFGLQYAGGMADTFGHAFIGTTSAKTETWTEQTFWDKFFGNGFFKTRTQYTATPSAANISKVYSNRRFVTELKNNTSLQQSYDYTETEKIGHSVSANVKGKAAHIEAAVEYKFSYETTVTRSAKTNVAPYTTVEVYISDIVVKQQYVDVKEQKQVASFKGWKNNGSASTTTEKIVEYKGCSVEFIER